jgi:hypothetical protein
MYYDRGDYIEVVTKKGESILFSKEDEAFVLTHSFYVDSRGRAQTNLSLGNGRHTLLGAHIGVMNPPAGYKVLHKSDNLLDNRRENLMVVPTVREEMRLKNGGYNT